jgi:hypothetical protein
MRLYRHYWYKSVTGLFGRRIGCPCTNHPWQSEPVTALPISYFRIWTFNLNDNSGRHSDALLLEPLMPGALVRVRWKTSGNSSTDRLTPKSTHNIQPASRKKFHFQKLPARMNQVILQNIATERFSNK